MSGRRARVFATAALTLLVACDGSRIGFGWDFERMLRQPRGDAYESSPVFADGRVMQPPPQGSVPREALLGPSALVEGLEGGVPVERFPLPVTAALLERGRDRFEIFCAACHGLLGTGETPVAAAMELRKPASLHQDRLRAAPPGRLFRVIGLGFGLMPAYAVELPVRDRWAVVAYVRALQRSQHARLEALPPRLRERARRGLAPEAPP